MIQRIQTIFLLAAAILLTCMFFNPFVGSGDTALRYTDRIEMQVLLILSTVIGYLNIFMYRKRTRQMRLCIFNCLILLGFQGIIAYHVFTMGTGAVFSLTAAFPAIAAILTYLALRYIARDEALVKMTERLRK
jgi:peptidoglycan/LPS O-acetylase OafA/YrhL